MQLAPIANVVIPENRQDLDEPTAEKLISY